MKSYLSVVTKELDILKKKKEREQERDRESGGTKPPKQIKIQ